jgi:serine phosphatase RsbU (regulator of sigma subunit)
LGRLQGADEVGGDYYDVLEHKDSVKTLAKNRLS